MAHIKLAILSVLAAVVTSEPPVQGYNYQPPTNHRNYNSHRSPSYLPPSNDYTGPSNSYLPPNNYNSHSSQQDSYSSQQDSYSGHQDSYNNYNDDHQHHDHGHGHDNEVPKSYEFGYSVKDAASGNDYDRRETSDGNEVRGEYRVALPDGRTQIVTYHADWKTGFHADVRYEGEARYPEPTHNAQQQGYSYNAPEFSGSLNGFNNHNTAYKAPSTQYGPPGYH